MATFVRVIPKPTRFLRVTRTGADGVERIAFIGYIAETIPNGDVLQVNARAPESLVTDYRVAPFAPPMQEHVAEPKVFDFWWKQLDYVFGLPNPRSFPPLPEEFSPEQRGIVERFVHVAAELADSGLLNAVREGFNVRMPDGVSGPEEIEREFSRTDLQVGFAALLRQCDSPKERANFERVRSILWLKSEAAQDDAHDARLEQLEAWSRAAKRLHAKSLNQLLRDRLVKDEGIRAFEYTEQQSPQQLLSIYNYGDLIHWDDKKSPVIAQWEADPYIESDRRLAYLDAASGLAHLYIGFAELARCATG